ncbi:MAG: FGGY family carbohydrate kinase, partial [Oscillospiraceae bacterium]|nr:FGGY family carbohydrate kinase [Oscillospiraceae bacterium]
MIKDTTVLAFDFGASGGRAVKAVFNKEKFSYKEVHRFENNPIEQNGHLCWDFNQLMEHIYMAIEKAESVDSIGFDTWGVDYGLLDKNGALIHLPVHYRDNRTKGILNEVQQKISTQKLYTATGNQIMSINTLFQLLAEEKDVLNKAKTLLFMPDLFAYMLSGKKVCELSISSTSQMLNPQT